MARASSVVHARAPLRISFAGGGTDVPPYPALHGGAVLSATIDRFAYASADSSGVGLVRSPDLDTSVALSGREQLARSVLKHCSREADVMLHCDAPPGSGLGSSSSLVVALSAALADIEGEILTPYELAERAVQIERDELGIPGGLQDQYAAAFGGFNFIEFEGTEVLVNQLRLRPDTVAELQSSLLLVQTSSVQRQSGGILNRQIAAYEREDPIVMKALADIKGQAVAAKACVLRGDIAGLSDLLHAGWHTKRLLAAGVATDEIDELYETSLSLGATGGKLLGAGGGGYLLLVAPLDKRGDLIAGLRRLGVVPSHLSFSEQGAQAWRLRG